MVGDLVLNTLMFIPMMVLWTWPAVPAAIVATWIVRRK